MTFGSVQLAASLMCARLTELGREMDRLELAGIDAWHIDIMDAHFVPNLALSPDIVRAIRPMTVLPIHAHLMVDAPEAQLAALADGGTDVVFFHIESTRHPLRLAGRIAERGMTPGIAINPATPLPDLPELLGLPHILLMAVEPGFAGQAWVPSSVDRVQRLRATAGQTTQIHVDGHIDSATLGTMWRAGATGFVCGSSGLFTGPNADYGAELARLRAALS